jgi:hypothetical protein
MDNNDKEFLAFVAFVKKLMEKYRFSPMDIENLSKLVGALLLLFTGMKVYREFLYNEFVMEIINPLLKSLWLLIFNRSKSVKGEDVKKQYFILLPLFLKLIEDDKKDENEEDEEIETSLEKKEKLVQK